MYWRLATEDEAKNAWLVTNRKQEADVCDITLVPRSPNTASKMVIPFSTLAHP